MRLTHSTTHLSSLPHSPPLTSLTLTFPPLTPLFSTPSHPPPHPFPTPTLIHPHPPPILHSLTCMLIVVFHLLEEVCPPFPPPQLPLQVLHVATVVLCQQLTLQALQLSLRLHQQTHNPGETCKGVATDYRVQREQQILVKTEFKIRYVGGSSKIQPLCHMTQVLLKMRFTVMERLTGY